jgi:hypothetical protein
LARVPYWRFYRGGELNDDPSNWFGPSVRAVLDAFESAGFAIECRGRWLDRAAFEARVRTDLASALCRTYEAPDYNQGFLDLG